MKVLKWYLVVIITAVVVMIGFKVWEHSENGRRFEAIEEMNSKELHYDADGYFLMIDTENGLIGIYDAIKPLKHYDCKVMVEINKPGVVWKVTDLELLGLDIAPEYLTEIYRTVPAETPVLVY